MIARALTQLSNISAVTLKYFLDIDIHHFRDSFAIFFVVAPLMQYIFQVVANEFRYNCQTVKDDAVIVKGEVIALYKKLIDQREKLTRQLA